MNLEHAQPDRAARPQSTGQAGTRLSGGWLVLARAAFCAGVVLVLALFLVSLPTYLAYLQTVCVHQPCPYQQLTLNSARSFQALGISVGGYAVLTLTLTFVAALVWMVMAGVLVWRRSDDWMALLVAFMLVVGGADNSLYGGYTTGQGQWSVPANLLGFLFSLALFVVFTLFPSGHFVPRWIRWLIPAFLLNNFLYQVFTGWYVHLPGWASLLGLLDFVGSLLLLILAQIYRYWRVSTAVQRQQTKWILFSLAIGIVFFLGWSLLEKIFPSLNGSLYDPVNASLNDLGSLLFPIAFAIAIMRYRLWEIDVIINRTLVYGALTASIIGLYILVVGYLGALFRTGNDLLISLVATGLVAVLFQPLRELFQRAVNRLLFGQRDEPYTVITRLSQRLKGTLESEAVLSSIVETVAQALKLPYAAILWKEEETFELAASYGRPAGELVTLPLVYQAETIGQLQLAPRAPGEAFTPADMRLLDELARQAGLAAHAVRLATDLQRARERLVLAREEERRRLRRDLHDGIGPTLASLSQRIDTACHLVSRDPDAAIVLLGNLKGQIKSTIGDIRRFVYALRPPVLDELGLFPAIREHVLQRSEANSLHISVEAPADVPLLPAAVEVAAYRITLEALTNVERHAHAQHCLVHLELADERSLRLSIVDDGCGLPDEYHAGIGITSMRERVAELGGEFTLTAKPGGGTHVQVQLPLKS
jgi:signal transduction histidine kinase